MVVVFTITPIMFNYFIYIVQKHTTGFWSDFRWWVIFSLPLIISHTLISQTWHMNHEAKISPWVTSIFSTVCSTAGTAFVLYRCYDTPPSWGKIIGFGLMVSGGLIAAYWK